MRIGLKKSIHGKEFHNMGHPAWNKGLKGWTKNFKNAGYQKGHPGYISKEKYREISKKLILIKKGKPVPMTKEHWEKFRKGGKLWSEHIKKFGLTEEAKMKIRNSLLGRKHTLERRLHESAAQKGEKSKQWKGGIMNKNKAIRNDFWFKEFRKQVFRRDDFTCQICASREGQKYDGKIKIEAHHFIPVVKLLGTSFEKYIFDIRNGITLCRFCHTSLRIKF